MQNTLERIKTVLDSVSKGDDFYRGANYMYAIIEAEVKSLAECEAWGNTFHDHVGFDRRWCIRTRLQDGIEEPHARIIIVDTVAKRQIEAYDCPVAFTPAEAHKKVCDFWGQK